MKKVKLKKILNEVIDDQRLKKMDFLAKRSKIKLEEIKKLMREEGYDI